ncbi:hypothetical protein FSP39_011249, partial [Pinctada imbricata]
SEEDLKVHCHSKLGEVLAVLKNILNSYPALQSTELFAASGGLISKIKSYNYGGPKDTEAEHNLFESIDTLALAFSSSVSDYLMGDLDNSSSEKEKEDKTKVTILGPEEIDSILSRLQAGVDLALQRAKAWSKYMKDIASYIERKTHLESEFSKNIQRLAQGMRPVLTEEGFLPLQSVYCTVLSQVSIVPSWDIEYANTCQATQVLLQTQKFVEPLTVRRAEHDKARKNIKDSWMKECKKMQDAVHSLRKAQNMYNTRQQEYDKARELACKTESDMLAQSSSGASSKVDKRKKLEEDAMHKAAEAETTYKACVAEANNRQQELENVKGELLAKVREQILQCDEVIRNVTVEYFHLLQTVTAPIPVQYHTLYETSKQYVPGVQYGEFVRRLSLTTSNLPTTPEQFTFEPYISSHPSPREIDNRKTSTQSTGSSSEMQSQDDSPQMVNRKDRYRVKAWAQGLGPCSDTDSASGSSKSLESSPSNSPHPSGRRNLVKSGSLDDLEETNGAVPGNILQMPATDGVDLQGILQRHGRRRNTTFGVDFQEQVQHCKSAVPPIITKCLKEVEKRGMSMKGIYRVSGVKSKVEGLCSKFEKNPELVELCDEHPNVISNVLKLYLRQLPEPLFTFKLYSSFIQTAKENMAGSISMEDTVQRLGDLASKLPYSNFKTSAILMHHLHRVAANHEINQMTASNLGIVFGPTLLRPLEGTASLTSLVDTPHQTRAVELIIVNVHEILGPDREHELIPAETPIEQLPSDARGKVHTSSQPGDHPLRDYQWYNKPIREEIQRVRYPQVTTCKAVPPHQLYLAGDPSPTSQAKDARPQNHYNREQSDHGVKAPDPLKQALQRSPKLPRQSSLTEGIEISCPEPIVEEDEVEGNDSLHLEIKSSPLPRRGTVPPSKASKSLGSSSYQGKKGFFTPPPSSKFTHDAFIKLSESYPNPRSSQSPQLVRKSPTPNLSPSILRTTSSYPSVAERQPYVPKFSPPVSRHSRVSFSLPEDSLSESESSLDSSHTSTMSSFSLGSPWSSPTISRPTLKRQNPVVSPPSKKAVFSYDPSLVRMKSSNSSLTSDTKSSKDEDISASSSLVNSSKGRLDSDESASGIEGKTTTRKPTTSVDTRGATTRECSTGTGAMAAETVTCTTDLMRNPVITSSSLLLSSLSPVLPRFHHTDKGQSPSSVAILSGNLPLRPTSSHKVMESTSPGKGKDLKENIEEKLGSHTKSETNVDGPCVEAVSKEDSSGSKCSSVGNEESSRLTCSSSKILVGSESPQQPDWYGRFLFNFKGNR